MDATALRGSTHAVTPHATPTAGIATTSGPSSDAIRGGGPVPAPAQPTLLGVKMLPAPHGQPQTIHLADGSMLVPLARVRADGTRVPLSVGGTMPAPPMPAAAAAPAAPVAGGGAAFEPRGFLYDDRYFRKFHDAGGIDVEDMEKVEERTIRSTFAYLLEEEPEVDDFGVTNVRMRRAHPHADVDLFTINPRAHWIVDVEGVQGDGRKRSIPSVVNRDGAVFVDPRVRNG